MSGVRPTAAEILRHHHVAHGRIVDHCHLGRPQALDLVAQAGGGFEVEFGGGLAHAFLQVAEIAAVSKLCPMVAVSANSPGLAPVEMGTWSRYVHAVQISWIKHLIPPGACDTYWQLYILDLFLAATIFSSIARCIEPVTWSA